MKNEIEIINVANGGYGIGKINGKTIFVDLGLPGDKLLINIYNTNKNYSFASIRKIIAASPLRVTPACSNFGICGGCSYLNVSYPAELELKTTILKDILKKIAGLPESELPDIHILSGSRFSYRSHASIKSDGNSCGFYMKESGCLVPFPEGGCLLLNKKLVEYLKTPNLSAFGNEFKIACDNNNTVIDDTTGSFVNESAGNILYRHDLSGFFQANLYLRDLMISSVIEYADPDRKDTFLDICCGCGFFSLQLARYCSNGYGFDSDKKSIFHAEYNRKVNNILNISFNSISENNIHPYRYKPDIIVIDPPRSGISKNGRKTINAMNVKKIIYVSCNPATFARDICDFIKSGYRLDRLTFIDMFPCTKHIEIITLLTKN